MPKRYLQPRVGITKIAINTMKQVPIAQNNCDKDTTNNLFCNYTK